MITLDLLNCNEVRSVPSPSHPSAHDDIGTVAAQAQAEASGPEGALVETLCPFQLLYPDGVERLGAESARERVRWVGAIWFVARSLFPFVSSIYATALGRHLIALSHFRILQLVLVRLHHLSVRSVPKVARRLARTDPSRVRRVPCLSLLLIRSRTCHAPQVLSLLVQVCLVVIPCSHLRRWMMRDSIICAHLMMARFPTQEFCTHWSAAVAK